MAKGPVGRRPYFKAARSMVSSFPGAAAALPSPQQEQLAQPRHVFAEQGDHAVAEHGDAREGEQGGERGLQGATAGTEDLHDPRDELLVLAERGGGHHCDQRRLVDEVPQHQQPHMGEEVLLLGRHADGDGEGGIGQRGGGEGDAREDERPSGQTGRGGHAPRAGRAVSEAGTRPGTGGR